MLPFLNTFGSTLAAATIPQCNVQRAAARATFTHVPPPGHVWSAATAAACESSIVCYLIAPKSLIID